MSTMLTAATAFVVVGAVAWAGLEATRPQAQQASLTTSADTAKTVTVAPSAPYLVAEPQTSLEAAEDPSAETPLDQAIARAQRDLAAPDVIAPVKAELISALPDSLPEIATDVPPIKIVEVQGPSCVERLQRLAEGKMIHFRIGSATVDTDALPGLRRLGELAQDCPDAVIHVAGHSDSSGSDFINLSLSWKRADNTVAALAGLGLDTARFEPLGFGARAPLTEGDATDDALDRRVEFDVFKKAGVDQ
jgi:outer membrane protein OmpA-like peptidoglycan-associated protein